MVFEQEKDAMRRDPRPPLAPFVIEGARDGQGVGVDLDNRLRAGARLVHPGHPLQAASGAFRGAEATG